MTPYCRCARCSLGVWHFVRSTFTTSLKVTPGCMQRLKRIGADTCGTHMKVRNTDTSLLRWFSHCFFSRRRTQFPRCFYYVLHGRLLWCAFSEYWGCYERPTVPLSASGASVGADDVAHHARPHPSFNPLNRPLPETDHSVRFQIVDGVHMWFPASRRSDGPSASPPMPSSESLPGVLS
jgi:hypothetical protein